MGCWVYLKGTAVHFDCAYLGWGGFLVTPNSRYRQVPALRPFHRCLERMAVGSMKIILETGINLPAAAVMVSPGMGDTVTLDSVALLWRKGSPNLIGYRVEISPDSSINNEVTAFAPHDTLQVVKGLKDGETYYWRVLQINCSGSGPYGPTEKFVVHLHPVAIRDAVMLRKSIQVGKDHALYFSLSERVPVYADLSRFDGKASTKLMDPVRPDRVRPGRPTKMS